MNKISAMLLTTMATLASPTDNSENTIRIKYKEIVKRSGSDKTIKPGRNRPAIGYDPVTHIWSKPSPFIKVQGDKELNDELGEEIKTSAELRSWKKTLAELAAKYIARTGRLSMERDKLQASLDKAQRHADRWRAYGERAHVALDKARGVIEKASRVRADNWQFVIPGGLQEDADAFLAEYPATEPNVELGIWTKAVEPHERDIPDLGHADYTNE